MLMTRQQIEDFCSSDQIRLADTLEVADLCETAMYYMNVSRKLSQVIDRFTAGTGVHAEIVDMLSCIRAS